MSSKVLLFFFLSHSLSLQANLGFFIKPASPEDLNEIQILLKTTYQHTYQFLSSHQKREDLIKEIFDVKHLHDYLNNHTILTAWRSCDNTLLGALIAVRHHKESIRIHSMAVEPEYQNVGIGSLLIKELQNNFPHHSLYTFVDCNNRTALSFFKKHHFSFDSDAINVPFMQEDILLLEKDGLISSQTSILKKAHAAL
jgi:ribosomal protein S18 acetylase RimI-like enzyme